MRWLWLAAFFTTFFWLHVVPIYTRRPESWLWLVVPALIAAAAGLRKVAVEAVDLRWLILLIPLALCLYVIPFPYDLPVLMVSIALLLMGFASVSRGLAWTGLSLGLVGTILAFQAAAFPFLYILSSRLHEIPSLTPFICGVVRLFHPRAGLSEHNIIINYVYDVFEFPTRLESLGFMPAALFTVAGIVILTALKRSLNAILGFIALVAVYSLLRYVFLIFLTVRLKTASIFWLPLPIALSYVPLVLALLAIPWFGRRARTVGFPLNWPGTAGWLIAFALVAAGVTGVTGGFAFHDPGTPKSGRLLIDELHSDWEWTTEPYDTEWYGRRSGYNYYSLAEYLKNYFHVKVTSEALLPGLLSEFDIVMLKTPTTPLSSDEIDALVEFVREGGGLWLLGDHTNVFGTSTNLNRLTRHFGLRLRYDSTYDLRTMELSLYEPPRIFPHPVVAFVPPYLFATSCSMESPFLSENMILGYGLKAMGLDYSQTSFFPRKDSRNYSFGVFLQQGGVKFGKGRVVLFTDSTCFSNFFMFIPGKPELALATVEWLNRRNEYDWVNKLLPVLGLISLAISAYAMRKWGRQQQAMLSVSAGLAGLALAALIYDWHVRQSYALPQPHTDFVQVAFEAEHSGFNLPTRSLTKIPETSLHTFYVWTQRLGLFPSLESSLEEALSSGDLVVIARPLRPFREHEAAMMQQYVREGGRLLVLVDPDSYGPAAAGLLELFGVGLENHTGPAAGVTAEYDSLEQRPVIMSPEGNRITPASRPAGLTGGEPILRLDDGRTVLTAVALGRGRVFVFSDFSLFTVETMGHTGQILDARLRSISELEFYILREILDIPQPTPYWK